MLKCIKLILRNFLQKIYIILKLVIFVIFQEMLDEYLKYTLNYIIFFQDIFFQET